MVPNATIWIVFSEDIAFAHHFVAIRLPLHSVGVLPVLATPVKKLLVLALHGWKVKYSQQLAKNNHVMKTQKLQAPR